MKRRILISTSTFGEFDKTPLSKLKDGGFDVILNPHKRKLSEGEVVELGGNAEGIIAGTENLSAQVLSKLKSLKVVSRCGVGLDNVDLKAARQLKIRVYSTPQAPTVAVAELTLGLILNLLRQIPLMDREIRRGCFEKRMGESLRNKTVGIVGFGKIGKAVGDLCRAFGAQVSFYDPALKGKKITGSQEYPNLTGLLKAADIITLHVPYSKETHHLIGAKEFGLMKPTSYLINCARGGIVDETALYQALKEKKIAGAALDVFEEEPYTGPLKELDNCILTPHIGSYAREARIQMETEAVQNLIKALGDQ